LLNQTIDKLHQMGLHAMAEMLAQPSLGSASAELSFEDHMALLVDREWDARENRRLATRLRNARLKQNAAVEDIDWQSPRGLDRSQVLSLAGGHWIAAHQHLIISGPTGVGKTFIACALGNRACRLGYSVIYRRVSRLLEEIALARADGSYRSLIQRLAKVQLLLLDDWGLLPLSAELAQEVLDLLEDRNGTGSTLIVTQIPVGAWHARIGDPTLADAILDRLVHGAHRIELRGESMRKLRAQSGARTNPEPELIPRSNSAQEPGQ
jgi:DNA replication protein DnaC